jgi:cytochrome P450
VEGFVLPVGQEVSVSVYALHTSELYWDRPHAFLPDRWADPQHPPYKTYHQYIPFSHGPRGCIGQR